MIFWFFGQPCSGKTTLIEETLKIINANNRLNFVVLDNDKIRSIYKDVDYSKEGRKRNIQRAMDLAVYENNRTDLVFAGFVTPYNEQRLWLQEQAGVKNAGFIYLHYNSKYDKRGRENFHVNEFEIPSGLVNYIRLDTGMIPIKSCVEFVCKFYLKMINMTN